MVCETFLKRGRMVGASSSGRGIDSGDFTYGGYICRSALLNPQPIDPWDWLRADINWSQSGHRPPLADGRICEVPAQGAIWLGFLGELQSPGALPPVGRGQLAGLIVTEFAGPFGAGGIGSMAQPLLGERVDLVLKPDRIAVVQAGDTLLAIAERYGTTRTTLRKLNPAYADYREWPGDAPLPLGEVLNLFAIRPSSPLPGGQPLLVPLSRPSTPLAPGSWLCLQWRLPAG